MPFPLHQSPTDSDLRFQNASRFLSLSACCIEATASSWHLNFLARCNTCNKQSVVCDVIIPFAQHYFYWNWCKAMFLFQLISVLLISITFYTYLTNIVFFHATWTLNSKYCCYLFWVESLCTGESFFEAKIEADSNDVTEYPAHYDQHGIGMIFCCILCSHLSHVGPDSSKVGQPALLLFGVVLKIWRNFLKIFLYCL